MNPPEHTILTIGHSNHAIEEFLRLLRLHRVSALADVRSSPFSRFNPQYNRDALAGFLSNNAIHYVFLGRELGARSDNPECYQNGRVQYDRLARTELFKEGLDRLLSGASRHRIALMCAEKEPLECHRTILVANALTTRGQRVGHIHPDGHLESHASAMERLFDVTGVAKEDLFRSHEELLQDALRRQEERIAYTEESAALTLNENNS